MADDHDLTEDGYPTDDALAQIEAAAPREALLLAERAWHWDGWATRELSPAEREVVHAEDGDAFLRLATGGWSGNESIVAALRKNWMAHALCWQFTSRGGLHIYRLPPAADAVDPHADSTGKPTTRD